MSRSMQIEDHSHHVALHDDDDDQQQQQQQRGSNGSDSIYHKLPRRHPRFSAFCHAPHDAAMARPSNRWSTTAHSPTPIRLPLMTGGMDYDESSTSHDHNINNGVIGDHSCAVDSYFGSIRVPATFLASTSFVDLFTVAINPDDTLIQRQLQIVCLICQGVSFVLSFNVIMLSSQALVRALTGNFDPFAETGYEFLFREFHFEFVCVRWSFIVSLYGFLCAVTAKILYSFELFNVQGENFECNRLELGIGVVLFMVSLMVQLHSYVNSTLVGWNNMTTMTLDVIRMLLRRGSSSMDFFSLLMGGIGLLFIILALIPGAQI